MECTWDRSAQTQSPGILTWRDGSVIHEWTCTSRIAHRHRPSQTVPLPACSQPGYAMAATSSARGSHAMPGPADGAHLHHHLPYSASHQRAVRPLLFSLHLQIHNGIRCWLCHSGRRPTGMTRNAVLFRLVPGTGGKPCWLVALFSYDYGSIRPRSLLIPLEFSAGPLTAVPRMASQVPQPGCQGSSTKVRRPTDTCPGTGDHGMAANNPDIEVCHGIDGMAWCGPGTVVSSEHSRHFNRLPIASHAQVRIRTLRYGHCGWRCHPAVLNAALILMMRSSMVRFERARREKNATAKDLHNGEQQHKTVKLQGTNWKGQSKVRTRSPV
ncbi:uncharacterized protein CCOS01_17024 [Colletotrichum costaricense]|uniref:Uncharacterized protein n=1 Tax=Colletotrichum costaricense TaxID=1209916 RepID=A0AAJ0DRB9_9PEZI|nr:uncharacterized protein CCOS01_17024 [Colletotrichum costaricense]KAK1503848.1 hypothetical protein CCOS01_17024 [Colletotrichum costaricense]